MNISQKYLYKTFKDSSGNYTHYTMESFETEEAVANALASKSKHFKYSKNLLALNLLEQEDFAFYVINKHSLDSFINVRSYLVHKYTSANHLISNEAIIKALASVHKTYDLLDIKPPVKKTIGYTKK